MNTLLEHRLHNYFFALVRRRSVIEKEIDHEERRPAPCADTLQRLQRQRLQMKSRMRMVGLRSSVA